MHTCACNLVGLGRRGVGASPEESRINQLQSQVDEVKAVVSDLFTEHMYKQCIISIHVHGYMITPRTCAARSEAISFICLSSVVAGTKIARS